VSLIRDPATQASQVRHFDHRVNDEPKAGLLLLGVVEVACHNDDYHHIFVQAYRNALHGLAIAKLS
jgi:hypothetical protein